MSKSARERNGEQHGSVRCDDALLVSTASSWCASHGVLMGIRQSPPHAYAYEPAPFSLRPTPFPRSAFGKAYGMALPFNAVVHRAASRYEGWLRDALRPAADGDVGFTGRLVTLADDVVRKGRAQNVALGILRSDYMLHAEGGDGAGSGESSSVRFKDAVPLQVELNTIASSFGCLSSKVSRLHRHLAVLEHGSDGDTIAALPKNGAAEGIAAGLAAAVSEYCRQRGLMLQGAERSTGQPVDLHRPVVLMIVQPGETNSCDQRDLEFLLQERHDVHLVRRTLREVATEGRYGEDDHVYRGMELLLPGDGGGNDELVAAAVVYYRAGYTPNDYPTDTEWDGRAVIEHSAAIKCPDVFYHLFGAKKVQQVLSEPGVLRQFCDSDEQEKHLSSCFAGLHALGEGDDSVAVGEALANPHAFVLKPQREGGGNNLYDDKLVEALKSMSYRERGAYILMQKIMPPSSPGKLVKGGTIVFEGPCVCELGVFGITLRKYRSDGNADEEVLLDTVVGHILRSKSVQTDEGGVAAGFAFLSSPILL